MVLVRPHSSSSVPIRIMFTGFAAVSVINLFVLFVYLPRHDTTEDQPWQHQRRLSLTRLQQKWMNEKKLQEGTTSHDGDDKNKTTICPFYGCPIYPVELTNPQVNATLMETFLGRGNITTGGSQFATENFATLSQQGKSHVINQDRALFISPFLEKYSSSLPLSSITAATTQSFLAAIFDGHGKLGHEVAQEAIERFPLILAEKLTTVVFNNISSNENTKVNNNNSFYKSKGSDKNKNILRMEDYDRTDFAIVKALNETFVEVNNNGTPSFFLGGSTASVSLRWGSKLYMANAGDSQTILVSSFMHSPSSSKVEYRTRRDKANLSEEKERILKMGGKIHLNANGFDPRVIVYSNATKETIGLAMSRSIGDWDFKKFGVISEPIIDVIDLAKFQSNEKILFLIAGSDGFFDMRQTEFFANQIAGSFHVNSSNDKYYINDKRRQNGIQLENIRIKKKDRPLFRLYDIIYRITPISQKGYRDDITAITAKL